ncbi:efflux RND transporter periplasmic adaptor subunit [Pokkaliibacter sp. CJK22405]|uniref:efflux RND transporter periplasmic adaptor subunit n=1 Tax=Pokkaliibacter sp. CJK22405 TaxID=3384615 RepID=UPI0039848901
MSQPSIERVFALFLDLEQRLRRADSAETLSYQLVNDAQPLFGFRHAALVIKGRVRAVTGISAVSPQAPFVAFIERAAKHFPVKDAETEIIKAQTLDDQSRKDWQELSAPEALWIPLKTRAGDVFGGIWLAREAPWSGAEVTLAGQFGDAASHAWLALEPVKRWHWKHLGWKWLIPLALLLLCLLIPVRQSVLAPAEVIPENGSIVAAPIDGVVQRIVVKPNEMVEKGQLLVQFDATTLKAQADVAERALNVAQAEYRAASQRAFQDTDSKARLDLLSAQVSQKQAERDYAQAMLARSEVRADQSGIAVFADADRWTGKPVRTGERIMEIANPAQASLKASIDVGDAIHLSAGNEVRLFLDSDPLTPHAATLTRTSYEAETTPAGNLAYRVDADFSGTPPRIGLRGTAKLYGDEVSLAVYLFRRPLAAIRQVLGL